MHPQSTQRKPRVIRLCPQCVNSSEEVSIFLATEQHSARTACPPFYACKRLFPPCVEGLKPAASPARKMLYTAT